MLDIIGGPDSSCNQENTYFRSSRGFLASTLEGFADALNQAFTMDGEEYLMMQRTAREAARSFGDDRFVERISASFDGLGSHIGEGERLCKDE